MGEQERGNREGFCNIRPLPGVIIGDGTRASRWGEALGNERKIRRMSIQAAAATWAGKPVAAGAQAAGSEDELRVLTREARLGSQAAFSAIFERFQAPLVNYIYRLVGDWDNANDLAQDTFLKAY